MLVQAVGGSDSDKISATVTGTPAIVIAAYKEAVVIGQIVHSLRATGFGNVIVVDDGSPDETSEEAASAGAVVLRHCANLGQGAALATGIRFAVTHGAQMICTFDADGQHEVEAIPRMIAALHESHADVVLGSRFLDVRPVGLPWQRRLLLMGAIAFTRAHTGLKLTDTHNGLRLLSRRAAEAISIKQPGMAHASEVLSEIRRAGLTYVEAPIRISYTEYSRAKGQSTLNFVKIVLDLLYAAMTRRDR